MDQRAKPGMVLLAGMGLLVIGVVVFLASKVLLAIGVMVLLAGNSHPSLTEDIASHLGVGVGSCLVYHNTNRLVLL